MKNLGIQSKLFIAFGGLAVLTMLTLGTTIYLNAKSTYTETTEKNIAHSVDAIYNTVDVAYKMSARIQTNNVNAAEYFLRQAKLDRKDLITVEAVNQISKEKSLVKIPTMFDRGKQLYRNPNIIRQIAKVTNSTVTIFQKIPQGYLRITTNIVKKNGKLAIGTYIPNSSPVAKRLDSGNDFIGRAYVVDGWYMTAYRPIKDSNGAVIGAIYTGLNFKNALKDFIDELRVDKVLEHGYYFVINSKGDLIVHPTAEGKNAINFKDADGNEYVKNFIKTGTGQMYQNTNNSTVSGAGKSGTQRRFMAFKKFEKTDWIIAAVAYEDDMLAPVNTMRNIVVLISALLILLTLGLTFTIGRAISVPMKNISAKLMKSSHEVNEASILLTDASNSLSEGATEQASSVEETTASLEEMTGMVKQNEESNNMNSEIANSVYMESEQASKTMLDLENSMKEISDSNEKIDGLVNIINDIEAKTAIMDEIVFQTKLLSFNASVEAERAGEHGRGFAVVAQEVGNLASMSGKAAQEIAQILKGSISEAQSITKSNRERVEEGNALVESTSTSMKSIMEMANKVKESSSHILEASKQQALGVDQIAEAMTQIDKSTQENAHTATKTSDTSNSLTEQAKSMDELVKELLRNIEGAS